MSLPSGVQTDIPAVGGGELNPNPMVVVCTKVFEDGLKIGRFCKLDTGSADNFDGSATPLPLGVVLRKVVNATEDGGVYDTDITEQVEILRSGMVTVEVKTGETPAFLGRVYISNAGDANDGLATATASDVAVNGEFIREAKAGVWEISLNLPQGDVSTHIADATAAHAASAIQFTPVGTIAATNAQTAIAEVATEAATALNDHVTDATAAHAGTAISNTPAGTIDATTVQAAINELDGDLTTVRNRLPAPVADPGNAGAIPVLVSGVVVLTSAGAETRTVAVPTFLGQTLDLIAGAAVVGNIVVTSAGPINQAGNTTMTFGATADYIRLVGITSGPGFDWRVIANDGVALG